MPAEMLRSKNSRLDMLSLAIISFSNLKFLIQTFRKHTFLRPTSIILRNSPLTIKDLLFQHHFDKKCDFDDDDEIMLDDFAYMAADWVGLNWLGVNSGAPAGSVWGGCHFVGSSGKRVGGVPYVRLRKIARVPRCPNFPPQGTAQI